MESNLTFKYDLECIIDDWVLMGFLIGNDFIPHLPTLHINKDAMTTLFEIYKSVMPTLDGYLNEGGKLNLARFEKFMAKLSGYDVENFNQINADLKYFNSKRTANKTATQRAGELENFFGADELDDGADLDVALEELSLDGRAIHQPKQKNETNAEKLARLGKHTHSHQDTPLSRVLDT